MNWNELWIALFGRSEWMGLNLGFWAAMSMVALIVILMNVVFWGMKSKPTKKDGSKTK